MRVYSECSNAEEWRSCKFRSPFFFVKLCCSDSPSSAGDFDRSERSPANREVTEIRVAQSLLLIQICDHGFEQLRTFAFASDARSAALLGLVNLID